MIAKAKQFGEGFAKDVTYIKSLPLGKKVTVLNNRFPGQTLQNDSVVRFMLEHDVISPEEYGMALLFDKNGNPVNKDKMDLLYAEAVKRYRDAKYYTLYKVNKFEDLPKSVKVTINLEAEKLDFDKKANKMYAERYMRRKVRE
jgi:hypothetical protein